MIRHLIMNPGLFPRWIMIPSHDFTINCYPVSESQFSVDFWPLVTIQRGIPTWIHNSMWNFAGSISTWNSDPSAYLLPVELQFKKVSKFNSVLKIQQVKRVIIQQKIHWILTPVIGVQWGIHNFIFYFLIHRHLVKSVLNGCLYFVPFFKSDCSPVSEIQERSPWVA